jgi:hypothetical protein
MLIWGFLLFGIGIILLIFSQRLIDKILSQPSSQGIVGSLIRFLAAFLMLSGIIYIILGYIKPV